MKVNKSKKGISLIVLIITIIVLLILVAVIALNLKGSNTLSDAYEAKFKSDITSFRDELTMWLSNEYGIEKQKIKPKIVIQRNDEITVEVEFNGMYKNVNDVKYDIR